MQNNDLKKRILDISFKHSLSHLGSCLTAVDIISEIYEEKKDYEPFILSSGHAGLALYVVLEKKYGYDAEQLYLDHGVHPNRDKHRQIWASSGSLGHGIGIGVGYALSNRSRRVHVLLSDGELSEGSVYEAFNSIKEHKISNINIHINYNGWGAYRKTHVNQIINLTAPISNIADVSIHKTTVPFLEGLEGLGGHYLVMTDEDYKFLSKCYD